MPTFNFPENEKLLEYVATGVAEYYAPGIGGAVVGALFKKANNEGIALSNVLEEVTRRFAEIVRAEIKEQALAEAQAAISSLQDVIKLLHGDIADNSDGWWQEPLGEMRISQAESESRRLIYQLQVMGEAGLKSLMTAGSLRLLVLATIGGIPGRLARERQNMIEAIALYERLNNDYVNIIKTRLLSPISHLNEIGERGEWVDWFEIDSAVMSGLGVLGISYGHAEFPFPKPRPEGHRYNDGSSLTWRGPHLAYYSKIIVHPGSGGFGRQRGQSIIQHYPTRREAQDEYNLVHNASVGFRTRVQEGIWRPYYRRFVKPRIDIIDKWKGNSGGFNLR